MSPSKIKSAPRAVALAITLGLLLAACSDIYSDRRETISPAGGDAVAANAVEQMNDPWPRNSFNKNLTFNGQRVQRAVGCYRLDKVTPPVDINPSSDVSALVAPPPPAACDNKMLLDDAQSAGGGAPTGNPANK